MHISLTACMVDPLGRVIHRADGSQLRMTAQEAALMRYLHERANDNVSREDLLEDVWGYRRSLRTCAVDNTVARLRAKIEADSATPVHLLTVRGQGYCLVMPTGPTVGLPAPLDPPVAAQIPFPADAFVGRADEVAHLDAALKGSERLLWITGPAGCGKTRIAQEALRNQAPNTRLAYTDLHSIDDLGGVLGAISQSLGLPGLRGSIDDGVSRVGAALSAMGPTVVLLDSIERVGSALPRTLRAWIAAAPDLTLIVTSRRQTSMPEATRIELGSMTSEDAAALFRTRAQTARSGVPLDTGLGPVLALLDGIPLAIELAAARMRLLSLDQLHARLDDRFSILRDRQPKAERHGTLWDAIDWSWEQLEPATQQTLAQCSIFEGGFDLGAAEKVVRTDDPFVLDQLEDLRDESLLELGEDDAGHPRFHLLSSVQDYARQQLDQLGMATDTAHRHRQTFLELTEDLRKGIGQEDARQALPRLEREMANVMAAFVHALADKPDMAADLAIGLHPSFQLRGPRGRTIALVDRLPLDALHPSRAGTCLAIRGMAKVDLGEVEAGRMDLEEALNIATRAGAADAQAFVHTRLGTLSMREQDLNAATSHLLMAAELAATAGEWATEARARRRLGMLAQKRQHPDEAIAHYEAAMALAEAHEATLLQAVIGSSLGMVHQELGHWGAARACFDAMVASAQDAGDKVNQAIGIANLGLLALAQGMHEAAIPHLEDAALRLKALGGHRSLAEVEASLARAQANLQR